MRHRPIDPWAFLAHVEVSDTGCWLWTDRRRSDGYGLVSTVLSPREVLAHRVMFIHACNGSDALGYQIAIDHLCHDAAVARGECGPGWCDHRCCVNPAHLDAVTIGENSRRSHRARAAAKRLAGSKP